MAKAIWRPTVALNNIFSIYHEHYSIRRAKTPTWRIGAVRVVYMF